tara:strand:+ start:85 stop:546 length:462 start_codon:yes stop_codon:yes gene_type:complete
MNTRIVIYWCFITVLIAFIVYLQRRESTIIINTPEPMLIAPTPVAEIPRAPEFRPPPIKRYKPPQFNQMGLLINNTGDTLPLYGKESRTHRNRYHYYTTTSGEQIFPIPITHKERECIDDIGCDEFYGNEKVSVLGKDTEYTAKVYRTDNFMV